ncbi:GABA permease [Blastomyces gilchristii SLH14081]|uniref:GABA permease n=1 Tax=Blastomyces gilchristii (strain SLH14081) TaxID=559298 RepID=A0A179UJX9_BLAGS|nr:GABA permease [Blastomyces gilchristii SLH14081]OAT07331.1 GABA permease [Blastomyces gilchristii SLH14081]
MGATITNDKLVPAIGDQGIDGNMSILSFNNSELADEGDVELLATMGYKQELRRQYSSIHMFAIAFSVMGLLPSIAASLTFSMPAGPAGMVWGWLTASGFIFIVGLAIADLASSLPTSGGLYWWTHYFAKEKFKNPLSFLVGYSGTIGLVGGTCSVDYGFALMILSIPSIASNGEWTASSPVVFGVFVGCVITHAILATFAAKNMHKIQTAFIVANVLLVMATVILLPIGKSRTGQGLNSKDYVFFHQDNFTTWPSGWTFMLAWLSPIWSIGGVDSCVYMSEEAMDAPKAVPRGILGSIAACWVLGFISICVIAACMNPDIGSLLQSPFGQPMAQIYYDALGKSGAIAFMVLMACLQYFMGLSLLLAASRQSWAFARDGALPFSTFFRVVSTRIHFQPVRTVWGCAGSAIAVGLLCLIHPTAAKALFSLGVAANDLAWAIAIFCRVAWGRKKFTPGPFYTGRLSTPIAIAALIYLAFAISLCMFPTQGPHPTAETMNYTVVVNVTIWGGALLYYFLFARKWFNGPKTTLN